MFCKAKNQFFGVIYLFQFNFSIACASDDKPVVVVTHGDLLTLSDRVRVRLFLAELLSIPPDKQIFDIPGDCLQKVLPIFLSAACCTVHLIYVVPKIVDHVILTGSFCCPSPSPIMCDCRRP